VTYGSPAVDVVLPHVWVTGAISTSTTSRTWCSVAWALPPPGSHPTPPRWWMRWAPGSASRP